MTGSARWPVWVWAIALSLALVDPIASYLVDHRPPEGHVATGLRKADTAILIHYMRAPDTGYFSPYATCASPLDDHSPRYFAAPFHWLYIALGILARRLPTTELNTLGIANGVGMFAYLCGVYYFLRNVALRQANLAFMLFAFGGGLGGVLFVVTGMLGLHSSPGFTEWFRRHSMYDLVEGPYLWPHLHMQRLYYTLPLAACLVGLAMYVTSLRTRSRTGRVLSGILLFCGALMNMRYGPLVWIVGALCIASDPEVRRKTRSIGFLAIPLACGLLLNAVALAAHPAIVESVRNATHESIWPTAFASSAAVPLCLSIVVVARELRGMRGVAGIAGHALLGYLALFAVLFLAYQLYFGNLARVSDHAAAVRVSDWAIAGAVMGGAIGWMRRSRPTQTSTLGWVILWFLILLVAGVAAFGRGWWLRFDPQRAMVLLGLPICILAAEYLLRLQERRPRAATALTSATVAIGVCSIAVSAFVFQGPFVFTPALNSITGMQWAYIPKEDATCLNRMSAGVVTAPPPYNDIASLRPNTRVVGGVGALVLSDVPQQRMDDAVKAFFDQATSDAGRKQFLSDWCVDYVFVPSTSTSRPKLPGPDLVERVGGAELYRVRKTDAGP